MAKTIILQSTEVDDEEFFDNWTDDYFEKCKEKNYDVEDTEEHRKLIKLILRYGSNANISRAEVGSDTKNSYYSKLGDRLNIQKLREGQNGWKSHPVRQQVLQKVFDKEDEEFVREYNMFIESKLAQHPHETATPPKKEQINALIKQAEIVSAVPKPDPFVLLPKWLNEPILRNYIESQLGFKIVKV